MKYINKFDINKLKPSVYNPRIMSEKEMDSLRVSMSEFSCVEPIVVNKDLSVIGGHQRLIIAKELGWKCIPIMVLDLSIAKAKALNIALNKIHGDWDYPKLKDLLEEIDTGEFDMNITGFDMEELEDLFTRFGDEYGDSFSLPDGDKAPFQQMTFTLSDKQAEIVKDKLKLAKQNDFGETGNENSNGNALWWICQSYEQSKRHTIKSDSFKDC